MQFLENYLEYKQTLVEPRHELAKTIYIAHLNLSRSHLFRAKAYFADPYSSWQRGTNENTNGLIRRYLPKRTDFTNLTQTELDGIVEEINNRPRKVLAYKTANEVYSEKIAKLTGVRIPARI